MKIKDIADQAIQAIAAKKQICLLLRADKNGYLKRRLGVMGNYRKHGEAAEVAVLDDAFYLVIAMAIIEASPFLRRRFKKLAVKVGDIVFPKSGDQAKAENYKCNTMPEFIVDGDPTGAQV